MFKFLNSLNISRAEIKLIIVKSFPSFDQVYNMVLKEEIQRSLLLQTQSFTEASAMVVKKGKSNLVFFHYGKPRHIKA